MLNAYPDKHRILRGVSLMNNLFKNKAVLPAALIMAVALTTSQPSYAGHFKQNHPRRAEVLHRDNNINNRINQDHGQLGGHYNQLERQDKSVQRQEQRDSRINGGYITPGQQAHLNGEENHINREVGRDYTGGGSSSGGGGGGGGGTGGGGGWGHGGGGNGGGGNGGGGWGNGGGGNGGGGNGGGGWGNGGGGNGGGGNGGGGWGNGGGGNGGGGNFAQNHPRRAQVLSQDKSLNNSINQDKGNLGGNYGNLERKDQSIANQEQRDARQNGGYITQGEQQHLDNRETNLQNQINKDYTPPVTPQ
jgi:hypothetical protein